MRRLFLSYVLMLSMAVSAQIGKWVTVGNIGKTMLESSTAVPSANKAKASAPAKVTLAANQKILGHYDTDDVATPGQGYGLPSFPGTLSIGSEFIASDLRLFDGGKVVKIRFGLANACAVSEVFLKGHTSEGNIVDIVKQPVDPETVVQGWNEVTLSTPVTLDISKYDFFLMGYTYEQLSDKSSACYPWSFKGPSSYSYIFLTINGESAWYDFGTESLGSLSVQAFVEKDYEPENLALISMEANAFVNPTDTLPYVLNFKNYGTTAPESYELSVNIDGNKVETLNTPVSFATSSSGQYSGKLTLPENITNGAHKLTLKVEKINGNVPVKEVDDDVLERNFGVYTETVARQKHLVEHFTSTSCTYCPRGDALLNSLTDSRDDVVRVSVHNIQNSAYPDPFYIPVSDDIYGAQLINSYPSASANRTYFDLGTGQGDAFGFGISYTDTQATTLVGVISNALDENAKTRPAFASIAIDANHDTTTDKLKVKVSGSGVKDCAGIMGDDSRLNVCVVEDSLVSKQLSNGRWVINYVHNRVLRAYVSDVYGAAINWNGDSYENEFSIDWNPEWNVRNMHVVAFLSRPMDSMFASDKFVMNAEEDIIKVDGVNSIGSAAVNTAEIREVARYSAAGACLEAPAKGLNIVKMSDGSVRKIFVK
ncbi:MAG: Omp28-related outer membrane protein [Prevotella sp.]